MHWSSKGFSISFWAKERGIGINSENHSSGQVWQLATHQDFAQSFLTFPCTLIHKLWGCSLSGQGLGSVLVGPIAGEGRRYRPDDLEVQLGKMLRTYRS